MAYDLVAIGGPVAGDRFPLVASDEAIIIGRTQRGINLPDPLVSVKHASLSFTRGGWTITDLDSATGVKVNGEPIPVQRPVALQVGDVVLIGECELQLDSGGSRVLRRLLWAMAPAWMMVFVAAGVLFWVTGDRPVTLTTGSEIHTPTGTAKSLTIPKPFIRAHALDVREMRLRRITDLDEDGVDELWLYVGQDEIIITFGEDGSWQLLGRLPQGCVDQRGSVGFPDLACDGIDYRMLDGAYRAVAQLDPVVWFVGEATGEYKPEEKEDKGKKGKKVKTKTKTKIGPDGEEIVVNTGMEKVPELAALHGAKGPVAFRLAMGNVDQLAGFLAAQGITEPVHYIICEDALPGMPAQALLRGGVVQPLAFGCGKDVKLEGVRAQAFEGAKISAIAFTAAGREMLPKHLAYTWSGAPDPLFVPGFYRGVVDTAARWPIPLKGGVYLGFESAGHVFHPIASEPILPDRVRLDAEDAIQVEAITATILSPGKATLDPAGCAQVEIRARAFRCAFIRGCMPGKKFIQVVEKGCGEEKVIATAGYHSGATVGATDNVEVRIEVQTQSAMSVTDVIQVRVGARPPK
ncbi:MAG: FHA domain-containing protein [Alphaproteobacteria bacterium]|nr:FHA domain-containing protein [Alphaproteobacteria bacterium]